MVGTENSFMFFLIVELNQVRVNERKYVNEGLNRNLSNTILDLMFLNIYTDRFVCKCDIKLEKRF